MVVSYQIIYETTFAYFLSLRFFFVFCVVTLVFSNILFKTKI